jgi:hypothetical protein
MAFLIGVVIIFFQGIGIFSSLVPFIVPIIVQSISKASVKFGNRNLNLLIRLPIEKKDPAFDINKEGEIVVSEEKNKDLFENQQVIDIKEMRKKKKLIPLLCIGKEIRNKLMMYC